MPLLVLHDLWLYLLSAALAFILLFLFCEVVLDNWITKSWLRVLYGPGSSAGFLQSSPVIAFNLLSFVVYGVAAYFGQLGYAFGWYAVVVATDIFVSQYTLTRDDESGNAGPLAPHDQAGVILISLVHDAIVAALVVGATLFFLQAVVLK
jgi:hypothetical protein